MYKWFLAFRYMRTKLIAIFGVASVMFCVAMVLIVLSVMGGFLDTIRERARGLHSEIILDGGTLQGFPFYEEFSRHLADEMPDIIDVTTPAIYTYGILRVPATTRTNPTRILGVHLNEYVKVNDFKQGLYYEHFFPGTTHLGSQSMPIAGLNEAGDLVLPADYVKANAKWRASEKDPEAVAAFDSAAFQQAPFPYVTSTGVGERVIATDYGPPRFEGPPRPGVIVGCDLLNERNMTGKFDRYLALGAHISLTLVPISPTGNPLGEPPVKMLMRYADDSHTGIYEIDSLCSYVDFDLLQEKLAMTPMERVDGSFTKARTSQLLIGLKDGVDINAARDRISLAWHAFATSHAAELSRGEAQAMRLTEAYTWEDLQRALISAVEKEKVLVTFLFGLISMVAMVLVGCIFYMIVEKKTKDIGILKSIGASGQGVGGLFLIYATTVGVTGAVLGVAAGTAVVWYINDIQDFLAALNPELRVWSPDVYSFDKIPNVVKTIDVIWVGGLAVLASVVGAMIPARIASRVWPVVALRYE